MVPHWAVVAATSSLGPAQTAPAIPNSTSSSTTGDRWPFMTGPPPSRVFVYRLASRGLLRHSFRDASPRRCLTSAVSCGTRSRGACASTTRVNNVDRQLHDHGRVRGFIHEHVETPANT